MKDDSEEMQRMLEKATNGGSAPPDELDAETASLREAWLAFGQMLETASPPAMELPLGLEGGTTYSPYSPLSLREGPEVRGTPSHAWRHWRLPAAALLAASLLVAVATAWMLYNVNQQADSKAPPEKIASTNGDVVPLKQSRTHAPAKADEPQWDDALDERFAQVGWQMLCVQHNQYFRTDAFGIVEYQLQQFSQAIKADKL
jgi:hypothetical protein